LAGNLVILCILACVEDTMDFLDYPSLAILLLMVGFALIIAEIFLPSGGLILVMCVVAFIASFWSAYKAWYGVSSLAFGLYLAALVILIPAFVIGSFQIFPRTPMGKRLIGAPTTEEVTPYVEEQAHLQSLIGHIGKAITPLIPSGMVNVNGERLHAFSEGVLIDSGVEVEILDVRGTRVLVREAVDLPQPQSTQPPEPVSASEVFLTESEADSEDDRPLDFDVPQS
jgi:membrane-bound ClpP family serine protease